MQSKESSGMLHYLSGGAWDPHDMNAVATTCESSVQFWDLRTMKYVVSAYLSFLISSKLSNYYAVGHLIWCSILLAN